MAVVVMTTLLVTFLLVVGLAVVVLLTVAAPTLRGRGSRTMHRIDAWAGRVLPVLARYRARTRTAVAGAVEARRGAGEKQETVQPH